MLAGAVGFDKAAIGGLTAAVLLDLALEFLQGGTSHPVHLLPRAVGGWRWGARPSSAGVPGSRPPTRPRSRGTLRERAGVLVAAHHCRSLSGDW